MESLKQLVARVMGVNTQEISYTSSPDSLASWDSFNGLMLVSELEKNFDVKFTIDEVMAIHNVEDIKKALEKHGVSRGL